MTTVSFKHDYISLDIDELRSTLIDDGYNIEDRVYIPEEDSFEDE